MWGEGKEKEFKGRPTHADDGPGTRSEVQRPVHGDIGAIVKVESEIRVRLQCATIRTGTQDPLRWQAALGVFEARS